MKARILQGWTITRALYTILGTVVIIQSATQAEWMGVFLGSYLAAMGIFAFGCAAGNCFGGNCTVPPARNNNAQTTPENVVFEEVK